MCAILAVCMYKDQEITKKNLLDGVRELLVGALSLGVVLASTHGALLPGAMEDLSPIDFTGKVIRELHTHNDFQIQNNHILIDPKHLRNVRSEGDKTAENDRLRGNWDVYQA